MPLAALCAVPKAYACVQYGLKWLNLKGQKFGNFKKKVGKMFLNDQSKSPVTGPSEKTKEKMKEKKDNRNFEEEAIRTPAGRAHWLSGLTDFETNALTTRPLLRLYAENRSKTPIKLHNALETCLSPKKH